MLTYLLNEAARGRVIPIALIKFPLLSSRDHIISLLLT
ncbi:MAG: hypothetical protein ACI9LM_001630, partial [Alteromonadaceae bacterium]